MNLRPCAECGHNTSQPELCDDCLDALAREHGHVWGSREGEWIHPSDMYEITGEDEF